MAVMLELDTTAIVDRKQRRAGNEWRRPSVTRIRHVRVTPRVLTMGCAPAVEGMGGQ